MNYLLRLIQILIIDKPYPLHLFHHEGTYYTASLQKILYRFELKKRPSLIASGPSIYIIFAHFVYV